MEQVVKKNKISISKLIVSILFFIYALTLIFVLFWGINISLMNVVDYNAGKLFPSSISFDNYIVTWKKLEEVGLSVPEMTFNSLWYAVGASALSVIFASLTSYVCAKYKFPLRGFVYGYAVITMMIPIVGSSASSIKLYDALHIIDTPFIILMFTSSFGQNFIILYATFKSVSWEYAEAAFVDGAGHFKVFRKIMLPHVISPMIALFLIEFIMRWGDSDTVLLFMATHHTFASGLYIYKDITIRRNNDYPSLFAALTTCTIPVVVMYVCFQKSIMDIQLGGGLKG